MAWYLSIAPTEPVLGKKNTAAQLCSKNPGLINTVEQEQERIHHHQIVNHSKGWWHPSTSDLVNL